ncbi:MAG: NF038122 family metalloprotease [Methylococcales bacterium]|nr:NF038122 family metalloprotease [Methylococcales bacterium]
MLKIDSNNRSFLKTAIMTALLLSNAAGGSTQASNLTITPVYDASITSLSDASAIEATINTAIAEMTSYVTTTAPVAISISFSNTTNGLGSNIAATQDISYSQYLSYLQALPNLTANQVSAYASLPVGPNTGINNANQVLVTAANLATLGDTTDASALVTGNGGVDDSISLNLSSMNITALSQNNPNNYDLQGVALHEIDEALGIGGWGSTLGNSGSALPTDVGVLDLYRYAAPGVRSFTLDPGASPYLSLDGGNTALIAFNTDSTGDLGDWYGTAGLPLAQDAFGTPGTGSLALSAYELTALNLAGYSLTAAGMTADGLSAVPLPASIWAFLVGLGIVRLVSRHRVRGLIHS